MAEVARVAVETPLPHLDRLFDFAIPEEFDEQALPGCRVKVRFHGRQVGGWLIDRGEGEFEGALQPLLKVVGPPVLTAKVAALCRRVADRYAGTLTDVLRFAVPKRVAAVEKQFPIATAATGAESAPTSGVEEPEPPAATDLSAWDDYLDAERFLTGPPGAGSWICHPHDDPFGMLATAAAHTASAGQGVILVVPDARDVRMLHAACAKVLDPAQIAVVSAEASSRLRYKAHLGILSGATPIVIGTRSAVFAPVPDLGLIAVWDDGDDVLAELQTPGWHAREVAALRAWTEPARVLVGGYVRTAATAQWVFDGNAADIRHARETARGRRYRVDGLTEPAADSRRIPSRAFAVLRAGLTSGPVLVQVPRVGGATGLLCAACGHVARCPRCTGQVRPDRSGQPRCRLCHTVFEVCAQCEKRQFVAVGSGSGRSTEQLQQAFPAVPVLRSDAESGVLDEVPTMPGIVVATPGAEPRVPGGYRALLILDPEVLLARSSLRAREEAARRWMAAIALTAPDAPTLVVAPQDVPVVQALVRNDLAALGEAERADRAEAHMPPSYRCVRLRGEAVAVDDWLRSYQGQVLGPLDALDGSQALLLAPHQRSAAMLSAVQDIQSQRSRAGNPVVEVRVDPVDLGDV